MITEYSSSKIPQTVLLNCDARIFRLSTAINHDFGNDYTDCYLSKKLVGLPFYEFYSIVSIGTNHLTVIKPDIKSNDFCVPFQIDNNIMVY